MRRLPSALLLVLLASLPACTASEWTRPYRGPLPGADPSRFALLVVDRRSGRPMEGAGIRVHASTRRRLGEARRILAEAKSNEFGVAAVEWSPALATGYWVVDHAGYSAHVTFGPPGARVELYPGRDCRGTLLDGTGQPSAGVEVQLLVGSVAGPIVRRATTGRDGSFLLEDVGGPQPAVLWAPAPQAIAREWPLRRAPVPGCVLEPIRPEPGISIRGQVVGVRGNPVGNAVVFSRQHERGPWARTDASGRFVIEGCAPRAQVDTTASGGRTRLEWSTLPAAPRASPPVTRRRILLEPPGDARSYRFWIEPGAKTRRPARESRALLETTRRGAVVVRFSHDRYGDGRLVVEGDRVGPESFPRPGTLTVDGAAGVIVEAWGASAQNDAEWAEIPLTSYAIRRGSYLRLRRDGGFATNYRVVNGSPPATIRLGNSTLDVRAAGAGSQLIYVDGERFRTRDGRAIVKGLDPGPHLLLVGDRIARVVLRPGERRAIDLSGG